MKKIFFLLLFTLSALGIYSATYTDNFEDGNIDGWAEETYLSLDANGDISITTADKHGGTYAMKINLTATTSGYDYAPVWDVPVVTGDSVQASAWLKWTGDGLGLRIYGAWHDSGHLFNASAGGISTYVNGDWTQQSYSFGGVAPVDGFFRLQIRVYGTTVPAVGYVDDVSVTVTTSTGVQDVPNIAAARALGNGAQVRINGPVVATVGKNGLNASANRNQFYIQDSTGALMVDDQPFTAARTYAIGDSITGIVGTLELYYDTIEIHPNEAWPAPTTGVVPTPRVLTGTETWEQIASQLIYVDGVTITGTGNWTADNEYYFLTPSPFIVKMVRIEDASQWVAKPIPTGSFALAGIATIYQSNVQIQPRLYPDDLNPVITPPTKANTWSLY